MSEVKCLGFAELLEKEAKSWWEIDDTFGLNDKTCAKIEGCEDGKGCWLTNPKCPRNNAKWGSVDVLKQWQERLREETLDIDKPSNAYGEVCKQNRQYRSLLEEVLKT